MARSSSRNNGETSPEAITLGVLSVIEGDDRATQRAISKELGIALGLTNAYLKRCVRKGFIKVRQIPANRYAYYLTPQGFAEKSRLTAEYLSISFNFFRSAREQCAELFEICETRRWNRVALAGLGDLAEIATLCLREDSKVEIVGVINTSVGREAPTSFAGLPVVDRLTDLAKINAVIVTDIQNAQRVFEVFVDAIPPDRVLTAPMLKVSRKPPVLTLD
ncbi:MAG: winged helix-turn-helix transcriptional regulator [Pseudomonadota bacterium]|nr:MarR family transcriptional regulator [Rhodospirillaceae bacterium]MEE2720353.1 winged helix-turn-helix transcriptional regulator [Pseudomonadota bacterium]|tara:strand:+ start:248 stop:907 length:660 start_codon:yes stop_codon:yes gene_type:complete